MVFAVTSQLSHVTQGKNIIYLAILSYNNNNIFEGSDKVEIQLLLKGKK